jgi:hypothetical protein
MSPSEILAAVPTLHFDGEALRWSGKIPAAVASAIQAQRRSVTNARSARPSGAMVSLMNRWHREAGRAL